MASNWSSSTMFSKGNDRPHAIIAVEWLDDVSRRNVILCAVAVSVISNLSHQLRLRLSSVCCCPRSVYRPVCPAFMSTAAPYRSMRALVVESYGKPIAEHVKLTTVPVPSLSSPSELIIRVHAAALNPIDRAIISGDAQRIVTLTLPAGIGFDVSGVVEQVGAAVTAFKPGDAVYARVDHNRHGTVADYCVCSAAVAALKPKTLSHDEAASLPLATLTALQALRDVGGLQPGQRVLILGGTGGVGTVATQLCRILGASDIVVTGSSEFNRSLQLGATRVIDYKNSNFSDQARDMDLCLDTTGEANASYASLKSGGTTVSIIAAPTPAALKEAGLNIPLTSQAMLTAAAAPYQANALLHNVQYKFLWMKPDGAGLQQIAQWVDDGQLKPVIDKVYTIDQFTQALAYLEDGHAKGKIVIHIAD